MSEELHKCPRCGCKFTWVALFGSFPICVTVETDLPPEVIQTELDRGRLQCVIREKGLSQEEISRLMKGGK